MDFFLVLFGFAALLVLTDIVTNTSDTEEDPAETGDDNPLTDSDAPDQVDPDALPEGVTVDLDDSQVVFAVTDTYSGGGTLDLPP